MISSLRRAALLPVALMCLAFAGGNSNGNSRLLSPQCATVLQVDSSKPNQRVLAELKSFLMDQPVLVGLEFGVSDRRKERAIERAVDLWQDSLEDSPFVAAAPGQKPHVIVRFVDRIEGEPALQGQIEMDRRFFWGEKRHSYRVTALMKVRDVFRGKPITDDELSSIVAHELGHLVGLDDVSDGESLMGPFIRGRSTTTITRPEVEAVRGFRQALRDRINALSSR